MSPQWKQLVRKTGYSHAPRVSYDDSGKEAGRPYSDECNEEKDKDIDDEESEESSTVVSILARIHPMVEVTQHEQIMFPNA